MGRLASSCRAVVAADVEECPSFIRGHIPAVPAAGQPGHLQGRLTRIERVSCEKCPFWLCGKSNKAGFVVFDPRKQTQCIQYVAGYLVGCNPFASLVPNHLGGSPTVGELIVQSFTGHVR